jgi:hypothetical protein
MDVQAPADDTAVLFLPHSTWQPGSIYMPMRADLDGMPCLSKESKVAVINNRTSISIDLDPPMVFSYFGHVSHKLQLPTHSGSDCDLCLDTDGDCPDGVHRLGPFLLLHRLVADPELEIQGDHASKVCCSTAGACHSCCTAPAHLQLHVLMAAT